MAQHEDGPDTSSIKPISSLRSKFENLGKEDATDKPIPGMKGRHPPPTLSTQYNVSRPKTSAGEDITATRLGPQSLESPSANAFPSASRPRRQFPDSPASRTASRPASVAGMSPSIRGDSPPLLTIDSPRSPRKTVSTDLRLPHSGQPPPWLAHPTGNGPATYSNNVHQVASSMQEARPSPFPHLAESPSPLWSGGLPSAANPDIKASFQSRDSEAPKLPPIVNRAAKPKVPAKPQSFARQPGTLAAPELSTDLTDRSLSPFSTPPSSGDNSPPPKEDPVVQVQPQQAKKTSDASVRTRPRVESDASWVQRIRGDSDASVVERMRTGSNASFVEPSSLPDTWQSQPAPDAVAPRADARAHGFGMAGSIPPRHRPVVGRSTKLVDELPEDRPRLPTRPELQARHRRISPPKSRSGRTSPLKTLHTLPARRSTDALSGTYSQSDTEGSHARAQNGTTSALAQGFERIPVSLAPLAAPAAPIPRRSVDRRRDPPPPPPAAASGNVARSKTPAPPTQHYLDGEDEALTYSVQNVEITAGPKDFPDGTRSNRRAPKFKARPWQIPTDYDTRLFAVCGEYVCTTGYITKVWNIRTGRELLHMGHRENSKATSIVFKPSPNIEDEGKRFWLGTNLGEIHEIDIHSQSLVKTQAEAHRRNEVIRMFRYASELWTLDDSGDLCVWRPDHKGMPSLDSQYTSWRVPKGHSFSIACGKQLWIATGKNIRVFLPGAKSDTEFQVLRTPLSQQGTGDVTSGATIDSKQDLVYFGHSDGKVSIYSRTDFSCQAIVNVSVYRIACLAGVGDYLWAGYSTGLAYVYDTSNEPWLVKKDWRAHEKQICSIVPDASSMWKMGRFNVITLGIDNMLRIWDGMLEADWLESRMHSRDSDYCTFRELTADVMTWNAGASKPSWLAHNWEDNLFFKDYLTAREPSDILVFGFQELVDLEDKKMTAKSLFKSKKKDPAEQEHISRQYRAWRDYLTKCVDDYMPSNQTYTLLHTTSMVGLFTCIFVKSTIRQRVRCVHTSEVKRGMGGHHGNKGALVLRMVLDDSSVCFINCHLAAGQTQTLNRNNDIAEILEANTLPSYPLGDGEQADHSDVFAGGGDGSMIMDHEICILNGDLNYRIDTMGRDAVIKQVAQGNLSKLLERDQLLLSRKKNPGFRLRAFHESQIAFAPTYKYNVNSDVYDTSEKRRAPAWCDRILYRGLGRVKMDEYRRWDQIRVSDHRPVSGRLRIRIKTVDPDKREIIWGKCVKEFDNVRKRVAHTAQLDYLTNTLGMAHKEAMAALETA